MKDETHTMADGRSVRVQSGEGSPAGRTGFLMTVESPTLPPDAASPIAESLRTLRGMHDLQNALGISQMTREDFARKILGVDPSTVYRWLHGDPIHKAMQDRITYYLNTEATPQTLDPSP